MPKTARPLLALFLVSAMTFVMCSPRDDRGGPADAGPATDASPADSSPEAQSPAEAPPITVEAAPEEGACPAGMRLVEGEYCFRLRSECLRSTVSKKDSRPGMSFEDFCFDYVPGSASCSDLPPAPISFRLLLTGQRPERGNQIEPTSSLGRQLVGKKAGEASAWGCKVAAVLGPRAKDGSSQPGSLVSLACPAKIPVRVCVDEYEYPNKAGEPPARLVSWRALKDACEAQGKRLCDEHEWTTACEGEEHLPYPYGWRRDNTACNISRCVGCANVHGETLPNGLCRFFDETIGPKGEYVERPSCVKPKSWLTDGGPEATPENLAHELDRVNQVPGVPGTTFLADSGEYERCVSPYEIHDLTGNVDEWTQCTVNCEEYPSNLKGGHYLGAVRNKCRPTTTMHGPWFKMATIGGRCCADPE